jgi:hypothetical protein
LANFGLVAVDAHHSFEKLHDIVLHIFTLRDLQVKLVGSHKRYLIEIKAGDQKRPLIRSPRSSQSRPSWKVSVERGNVPPRCVVDRPHPPRNVPILSVGGVYDQQGRRMCRIRCAAGVRPIARYPRNLPLRVFLRR